MVSADELHYSEGVDGHKNTPLEPKYVNQRNLSNEILQYMCM